jgi:hypothetical protein
MTVLVRSLPAVGPIEVPDGHVVGFRLTGKDLKSRGGFQWPETGPVEGAGPFYAGPACPTADGDGLCAAFTWRGVYSSVPAHFLQVVAWLRDDELGASTDKARFKRGTVLKTVPLARAYLAGAYLAGAYLPGAVGLEPRATS